MDRLSAAHLPPIKVHACRVAESRRVAQGFTLLTLCCPELAASAEPGQFVAVRCGGGGEGGQGNGLLLRRPISICAADAAAGTFDLLVKAVGKGSAWLAGVSVGRELDVLGPLGNGFPLPPPGTRSILVGGGFGVAPLLFLAQAIKGDAASRGSASCPDTLMLMGASCEVGLLLVEDFERVAKVRLATDDGSCGVKGYVTRLLAEALDEASCEISRQDGTAATVFRTCRSADLRTDLRVYACGPKAMMREAARLASEAGYEAYVSLEEHMACGVGACLVCACAMKRGGYARVCADGPIFLASEVDWDA